MYPPDTSKFGYRFDPDTATTTEWASHLPETRADLIEGWGHPYIRHFDHNGHYTYTIECLECGFHDRSRKYPTYGRLLWRCPLESFHGMTVERAQAINHSEGAQCVAWCEVCLRPMDKHYSANGCSTRSLDGKLYGICKCVHEYDRWCAEQVFSGQISGRVSGAI